jgi:uncharacterized membrane protein YuzA (DUF378 family)
MHTEVKGALVVGLGVLIGLIGYGLITSMFGAKSQ